MLLTRQFCNKNWTRSQQQLRCTDSYYCAKQAWFKQHSYFIYVATSRAEFMTTSMHGKRVMPTSTPSSSARRAPTLRGSRRQPRKSASSRATPTASIYFAICSSEPLYPALLLVRSQSLLAVVKRTAEKKNFLKDATNGFVITSVHGSAPSRSTPTATSTTSSPASSSSRTSAGHGSNLS